MRTSSAHASRGFSLIEVMISILIISTALLGFAGVQAVSVNNTTVARYHALAAIEVSSLAAAMSANHAYWGVAATASTVCVATTAAGQVFINQVTAPTPCPALASSSSGVLSSPSSNCLASGSGTSVTPCTPLAMAAYDVSTWAAGLTKSGATQSGAFVQPSASIACAVPGSGPVNCLITLTWQEKNVAINNNSAQASAAPITRSYSQVVQP
jgi:type IV pilus assembly protein PilV